MKKYDPYTLVIVVYCLKLMAAKQRIYFWICKKKILKDQTYSKRLCHRKIRYVLEFGLWILQWKNKMKINFP